MNAIRIKICGVTHPEDALTAAEVDAGAVGLVFYAKSKRAVTAAQAKEIAAVLSPFVSTVVLSVNEQPNIIREILHQAPIDVTQSYGDEDDDFCRQLDRPYLEAVCMQSATNIQTACTKSPNTHVLLFDVYHPTRYGGTGQSFDWTMLSEDLSKPWILAGGLTPKNVTGAVRTSGATAVDISGGMESSAGIKDKEKMAAFMTTAKVA